MFSLIGKSLGPYRILEQVGIGGMATVYKAYQPSMDRYVAIKILPPHLSQDEQFVRRFQREAHAIAKLEHAHILPVYDYGESEGVTYIVMRYIAAGTLKAYVVKNRPTLDEVARLIGQIASALEYAHRMGVIHRDVKPNNILVDEQGNTYLTDFGLARMLESTQQLTGSGVGVGTPAYMSPEQGKGIKADHRSDIYSLGVILYEMVTGHVPYEAETPMAVVLKHITEPLPLPRTLFPGVPEAVELVILRALAKEPAHRYQSAGEMAEALNAAVRKTSATEAPQPVNELPKPETLPVGPVHAPKTEQLSLLTKMERLWQKPRGKAALIGAALIGVALLGWLLSLIPGRIAVVAPETAAKPGNAVTATIPSVSLAATNTPFSTREAPPVPNLQPEQARTFAEPILQAIADRAPDFEDDFSTTAKGWEVSDYDHSGLDRMAIAEGRLRLFMGGPRGLTHVTLPAIQFSDFVLTVDAVIEASGVDSVAGPGITWRNSPEGGHTFVAWTNRIWETRYCGGIECEANYAFGDLEEITTGKPVQLMVIAQGSAFALYVNGKPLTYVDDPSRLPGNGFSLVVHSNAAQQTAIVAFDNFKIWNLAGVPITTGPQVATSNLQWERLPDAPDFPSVAINTLAVDPKNADKVFVGTYGAGIYVSPDGGKTWQPANTGLGKGTVGQLVVHPLDSRIVYAALFDQGGIYKSTDGGQTWQAINNGIIQERGWNWTGLIYVAPDDIEKLYFSDTTSGLYRSTDGGNNWDLRSSDCPQVTGLVIDPNASDHLFASGYNHPEDTCIAGVYESADAGYTWKLLTTPEMRQPPDQWGGDWWHIAVDPQDFNTLYAGGQLGTYKSSDAGQTWNKIHSSCPWLAANPYSGEVYCGSGEVSRDGGKSWVGNGLGNAGSGQESLPLAFAAGGQTVYAGSDQVLKSVNGGRSWERLGWLGLARGRLVVNPTNGGQLFFSTIDNAGQLFLSRDGGQSWRVVLKNVNAGSRLSFQPEGGVMYFPAAEKPSDALYRSKDGLNWEKFASGLPTQGAWQLLPDPQNPQKLWLVGECGTPLVVSTDGGQTFAPAEGFFDGLCQPILLMDKTGQRLYVVNWGAFYRSGDGGAHWIKRDNVGGIFRAALLDPTNPEVVYLGSTHSGLLKSVDGGDSWARLEGLPAAAINDLASDPQNSAVIYAATDSGVFVSINAGLSWAIIDKGLGPNPVVYSVAIDPNDASKVYSATPDGVFQLNP